MTNAIPDDFLLTDRNGVILGDGSQGFIKDRPNIFSYLVFDRDRDALRDAMAEASEIKPRALDLTFCFLDKTIVVLCHVYKGENGYLIAGWKRPDNIRNFSSYTGREMDTIK